MAMPDVNLARIVFLICTISFMAACTDGSGVGNKQQVAQIQWLIPENEIIDGGPGPDGIPSLDVPQFESVQTITSVDADDLLIVVQHEGQTWAYPHDIMNWHEIVNHSPADNPYTVSYCPLTGSAVAWQGDATSFDPTFGTSGLLYNSNLILFDRASRSWWSQMLQQAVAGRRIGELPTTIQVVEMPLSTLQQMYPDANVLNRITGHSRDYDISPYGDYTTSNSLLFPVSNDDRRLHRKERVMGVRVGGLTKAYQIAGFGASTQAINEQLATTSFVVVGNTALNFSAVFNRELPDGTILAFTPIQDDLPNVMTDSEGNVWDIFGSAVSGPRVGTQLGSTNSYTAMWFAWAAFFETSEIHFN